MVATMGDQIGFNKLRFLLIPIVEGADGDLIFQQFACFGRTQSLRMPYFVQ